MSDGKITVRLGVCREGSAPSRDENCSHHVPGGDRVCAYFSELPSCPTQAGVLFREAEDAMFIALLRGNLDRYLPMIPAVVEALQREPKQNTEPKRSPSEAMALWAHLLRLSPRYTETSSNGGEEWVRAEQSRVLNEQGPDALRFWICFDGSWFDPRYWRNVSDVDPEEMAQLWRNSGLVLEQAGALRLPNGDEVN